MRNDGRETMITSIENEKLKLVRRLHRRRRREQDGLFVTEGEDLVAAGRAAGREPVELLTAAGEGLGGTEVEPALLDRVSALGSGTRAIAVWERVWLEERPSRSAYLHGVSDPGNVGAVIRSAAALADASVCLGPDCADPFSPAAARASMGAIFTRPPLKADLDQTPQPRAALIAEGGGEPAELGGVATVCVGAEREGLPAAVVEACEQQVTIPQSAAVDSLNVAAAAAIALYLLASGGK